MADLLQILAKGMGLSSVPVPSSGYGGRGWHRISEPFSGAWQRGLDVRVDTAVSHPVLFRCISLIASDFAKLRLRLVTKDGGGVWSEVESPAFGPVLRKPNRYQTRQQFLENWQISKQLHGNAYILKERDARNVVVALYVLDPQRVRPLVGQDGSVWYQLSGDYLAGIAEQVTVPAREIVHDRFNALFHPLCGLSPIYAAGLAAAHGQEISRTSALFFKNGAQPGGVLTHPDFISDELAREYARRWQEKYSGDNQGRVAVLGDGLKYEPLSHNAVDSQLVEQIKASDEKICSAFGVPAFLVGVGAAPLNNNAELLTQHFYNTCLQSLIEAAEACLDEALALPANLGVEFDLEGLLRMDTATQAKALGDLVGAGILAPNEARARLGLKPVKGGESPMAQQQQFSLAALAERDRDRPFAKPDAPAPAAPATPAQDPDAKTFAEKARPVLEGFAVDLAHRTEKREAAMERRLAKLEAKTEATRLQVNGVVKALPSVKPKGGAA